MGKSDVQDSLVGGRHTVCEFVLRAPEKVHVLLIEEGKSGKECHEVLELCRKQAVRYQFVPRRRLESLPVKKHQGYVARLFPQGYIPTEDLCRQAFLAEFQLILTLDHVQDEGNLGTLSRSLFALGGAGLVLPKNRTAPLGQLAQHSAAGALSELPVARETNLARFLRTSRDKGILSCYAGTSDQCHNVFELQIQCPMILVLGNEEKGVRPSVAKACDLGVTIPMRRGFDSLNVAQAGAMLMMEFYRRTR